MSDCESHEMDMMVSVVIPTYNRAQSLKKTLLSLLAQKNVEDNGHEIIVVDNNSSDATKSMVEHLMPTFGNQLTYLFEPRQGKIFALNRGISAARGDIIAMTDDDCAVSENWLSQIKKTFQSKDIDLLAGKVVACFDGKLPKWLDMSILRAPLAHYDKGDQYFNNSNGQIILPTGANNAMRKSSIARYGDYQHPSRGEDTELGRRWHKLGARIAYTPDVIVYHYNDTARLDKNYFRKWYFLGGKNTAIIGKTDYQTGRCLFKIPLWVYKELLLCFGRYIRSLVFLRKDTFSHEAFLFYYFGLIWGSHGLGTKFENLR